MEETQRAGKTKKVARHGVKKGNKKNKTGLYDRFLLSEEISNDIIEAYKEIRTNLLYMPFDAKCKRIVVTSSIAREGKTLTSINISISLAQLGLKVLLIDADMRASLIKKYLDIPVKGGLSECLAGIEKAKILKNVGKLGNVDLLLAGELPPNPSELLMSERMHELIELLSENYDYIIIDTPPVNVVTDATTLIQESEGYLLVIRDDYSDINGVQKAVEKLSKLGANICGIVMNDVKKRSNRDRCYSYKDYYSDGYYY